MHYVYERLQPHCNPTPNPNPNPNQVRAEWGATLREVGDESIAVAHALDTAQSWWAVHP